jgi:hypothetical protein
MVYPHWWDRQGTVHVLVDMAAALDAQYPGRAVYAVGHSPSWLVYALGEIRRQRGDEARIGYIPHSGSLHKIDRADYFKEPAPAPVIHYNESQHKQATAQSLSGYFNFLTRHRLDPLHIQKTYAQDGAPVLVDFSKTGEGFASFLRVFDDFAERQGATPIEQGGFGVHVYKMGYEDGAAKLEIAPLRGHDHGARTVECAITSGVAGDFMNLVAGVSGYTQQRSDTEKKMEAGRFLPYYALADQYREDGHCAGYAPPANGLRTADANHQNTQRIKELIRDTVAQRMERPVAFNHGLELGRRHVVDMSPTRGCSRRTWVFVRAYH